MLGRPLEQLGSSDADSAAVAFHGLALYFMVRGFQASRRLAALRTAAQLPPGIVPPITPR